MDRSIGEYEDRFDIAQYANVRGGQKESRSTTSSEYLFVCPSCSSDRLRYNHDKKAWICWGCHKTGGLLGLISALDGCDDVGAIGLLIDGSVPGGASLTHLESTLVGPVGRSRSPVRLVPPRHWPGGVDRLTAPEPGSPHAKAWEYLTRRGLMPALVREYGLGYGRMGKLAGYVIFPCMMDRQLTYWQGRASFDPPAELAVEDRKSWIKLHGYRKTMNPSNEEGYAVAAEVVFNIDRASTAEILVVTEGPLDAMKVGPNAVALLGKTATPAKLERLKRTAARKYVIYLDPEARAESHAIACELCAFGDVYIACAPVGYDPGALSAEQNAAVLSYAVPFDPGAVTSILV